MKRQKNNLCVNDLSKIGKSNALNSSSNYSTCSDDFQIGNDDSVRESTIISGQIYHERKHIDIAIGEFHSSGTTDESETNYPINILDQNIDVLTEDDDVFLECNDTSKSISYDNSTVYLPLKVRSELSEVRSSNHFYDKYVKLNNFELITPMSEQKDDLQKYTENKPCTTILGKTEISSNLLRKKSPENIENRTGGMVVEVINKVKKFDNLNKNPTKRVLFVNENNTTEEENHKKEKSLPKNLKSPCLLARKGLHCANEKLTDENCNVHNTTESFVLWEKFCKASESSQSLFSEYYGGDDENSTSYKTLDDSYLLNCSIELNEKAEVKEKFYRHRSKSCDSILREVRHLPHIVFDRFLKCLSEEIENIRKKNIICTCKKNTKKHLYKENIKSMKTAVSMPVLQFDNLTSRVNNAKSSKLQPKVSPCTTVSKESRLSPRSVTNNSENISRNQKSPKTPTNSSQKRGFYSWQKEIVSPVGEYIRGKRSNPFQNSPSKKKV